MLPLYSSTISILIPMNVEGSPKFLMNISLSNFNSPVLNLPQAPTTRLSSISITPQRSLSGLYNLMPMLMMSTLLMVSNGSIIPMLMTGLTPLLQLMDSVPAMYPLSNLQVISPLDPCLVWLQVVPTEFSSQYHSMMVTTL